MSSLSTRPLSSSDAPVLARLHTHSWRTAYRGILTDYFLDNSLEAYHADLWRERFETLTPLQFGALALLGDDPVGFAFACARADPRWGTQLDNLHVETERRGHGIGRTLLGALCTQAEVVAPGDGLFLWVYEKNAPARRFYEWLGAEAHEHAIIVAPDGRESGEWRYVWSSLAKLMQAVNKSQRSVG
jgi:GNAT superfamily N-acetyltransferase